MTGNYNYQNLLKGYRKANGIYRHNVPVNWHILPKELKQSIQREAHKGQPENDIQQDDLGAKIYKIISKLFSQEQLNKSLPVKQPEDSGIPDPNEPDEVWARVRDPLLIDIALVYYDFPLPIFRTYSGSFEVYWQPVLDKE